MRTPKNRNDTGKECCICLRRLGIGRRTVLKIIPASLDRIRRWEIEENVFPKIGLDRQGGRRNSENIECSLIDQMLWEETQENLSFMTNGDEQHHWGNHPELNRWRALRCYYRNHTLNKRKAVLKYRFQNGEKERIRRYNHMRRRKDHGFRMRINLGIRLYAMLRRNTSRKKTSVKSLLGCTLEELIKHIESKFQPGMSWENYGPVWHIDHIVPCAVFDLRDESQQRACFHFENLQPLFALDNIRKGASTSWAMPA